MNVLKSGVVFSTAPTGEFCTKADLPRLMKDIAVLDRMKLLDEINDFAEKASWFAKECQKTEKQVLIEKCARKGVSLQDLLADPARVQIYCSAYGGINQTKDYYLDGKYLFSCKLEKLQFRIMNEPQCTDPKEIEKNDLG